MLHVRGKGPNDSPFLYTLTLPCERSLWECSRHIFTIFCAPIRGVVGLHIIFITFGHWLCVNVHEWPKSYLLLRFGPKSHIIRWELLAIGVTSSFFYIVFSTSSLLTKQPTPLVFWRNLSHHHITLLIGVKAREFHREEFLSHQVTVLAGRLPEGQRSTSRSWGRIVWKEKY